MGKKCLHFRFPTKNDVQRDPLSWLYQKLNKEWHFWLPGNNSETILRGGFYSVLAKPKLRIISMNMNYCYAMNWYLIYHIVIITVFFSFQ